MPKQPNGEAGGRKLYAIVVYEGGVHRKVIDVSHSARALRRRNPLGALFAVRLLAHYPNAAGGAFSEYEFLFKKPIHRLFT